MFLVKTNIFKYINITTYMDDRMAELHPRNQSARNLFQMENIVLDEEIPEEGLIFELSQPVEIFNAQKKLIRGLPMLILGVHSLDSTTFETRCLISRNAKSFVDDRYTLEQTVYACIPELRAPRNSQIFEISQPIIVPNPRFYISRKEAPYTLIGSKQRLI